MNVFNSKKIIQNTVKIRPEINKSLIVNVLLVYAIKLGGVEEGNKKEQLQQQVTGNNKTRGLI